MHNNNASISRSLCAGDPTNSFTYIILIDNSNQPLGSTLNFLSLDMSAMWYLCLDTQA
jgi:hypothetical protein